MHTVGKPINNKNVAVFGTDGIRGKVGTVLTPEFILQLGYWCSHVLPKEGPVLIGQDSRQSGDMLTAALTAGLTAAGKEVWLVGLCPTPAVGYLIKKLKAAGGLMVSASHNPPEYNGVKIFDQNGVKLDSDKQLLIESSLNSEFSQKKIIPGLTSFGKAYQRFDLLEVYENGLIESAQGKSLDGVPIVLDLCWGSATSCGAKLFKALGAELTLLNSEPNGRRINVGCGSTHLNHLREAVLQKKAEMGFAFDGDADRMLAIDGKGRTIDGDHVLYLWGTTLKDRNELPQNRIVATVMSNLGFEKSWKSRGGLLERTPVGDQNVYAEMISKGATLGGEQSGHILSAINGLCGDGLLTAIQISTICHSKKLKLEEWREQSFKSFPQKLVNISIPKISDKDRWQDCESIQKALSKAQASMGQEGRVLIRTSGTEPLIRIMVEAADQADVDLWTSELVKTVKQHLY